MGLGHETDDNGPDRQFGSVETHARIRQLRRSSLKTALYWLQLLALPSWLAHP
ncbi:hypothetical protein PbB2_00259 [Candidatus Phycosocius bacilliformis]|uniref:Uncharacterized protein n=1 Tax=Candidatus Phycosocius bacilliformis TaxID=1445552 RepID=A0A2P2E6B6_9PROT|nr:hypothetical protein PbB2_00259 [Candidatus Phycosocius bacilliformis]